MLVEKYFPAKNKQNCVADSSGPGWCGIQAGMLRLCILLDDGGDEGVPRFGMQPGWPRTPRIAKFHLPLSRTKLLI